MHMVFGGIYLAWFGFILEFISCGIVGFFKVCKAEFSIF